MKIEHMWGMDHVGKSTGGDEVIPIFENKGCASNTRDINFSFSDGSAWSLERARGR